MTIYADDPGSALSEGEYVSSFFLFNLTTWMKVFSQINDCQQNTNKQTKQKGGLRF